MAVFMWFVMESIAYNTALVAYTWCGSYQSIRPAWYRLDDRRWPDRKFGMGTGQRAERAVPLRQATSVF